MHAEELDGIVPFMQRYASELSYSKSHVANLDVSISKVCRCRPLRRTQSKSVKHIK